MATLTTNSMVGYISEEVANEHAVFFVDSPVIVGIIPGEIPTGATFHRVHVRVNSSNVKESTTYEFNADATSGENVYIDISSALRSSYLHDPDAVVEDIKNSTNTEELINYSWDGVVEYNVQVWDSYLIDGVEAMTTITDPTVNAVGLSGGLSEYERISQQGYTSSSTLIATLSALTHKPVCGEISINGGRHLRWYYDSYRRGKVRGYTSIRLDAPGTFVFGDREIYLANETKDMTQFMFLNSLGVVEDITARSKDSLAYNVESEEKALVNAPALVPKRNLTAIKTGGRAEWEMSSGWCNREWADWWVTEFLMAKKYWMKLGTQHIYSGGAWMEKEQWIPVTIEPADDTTIIYDKTEPRLCRVDFTVRMGISGSFMNPIQVYK